jgi:uncharacterized protein (TIGR03437 family)
MDAAHRSLTRKIILFMALALLAAAPALAADALTVDTSSVSWSSTVLASQVTVGSTGGPIPFTARVDYGEAVPQWLVVTPDNSTAPATVLLRVGYSPYPASGNGPFHATVTFSGGGSTASVAVTYSPASTGGGASGPVSATPSPLSLQRIGAGIAVSYLTVSSSSPTPIDFAITQSPTVGWSLSPDRAGGTVSLAAPVLIAVTAQTASSASATYSGTITISPTGQAAVPVPVNFTVSGGGGGVGADTDLRMTYGGVTASNVGITLTYNSGDSEPQAISIPVMSASGNADYYALYGASVGDPGDWVYAWQYPQQPPEFHTMLQDIAIGFRRVSTLPTGTYHATFEFAVPSRDGSESGDRAFVNITLYVNTTPTNGSLTFTPASWNVSAAVGGSAQSQNFAVSMGYNVTVGQITSDRSWLTSGAALNSGVLTVTVDPAGLTDGVYHGNVVITYNDNGTAAQSSLPVTFTVGSGGGAGGGQFVSPGLLTFAAQPGMVDVDIPSQIIVVPGPAGETYSASGDQSWLRVEHIGGSPSAGALPGRVGVSISPAGLTAQSEPYTGNVRIQTPNGEAVVPVRLMVTASPVLKVVPGTLVFVPEDYDFGPKFADVLPSNQVPTAITVTPPASAPWLSVTTLPGAPGATIRVTANPAGLSTGTYGASIQFAGAGMANSPITLPVVLMVNGGGDGRAATLTLSPTSLSFTSARNGIPQEGTLSVTSASGASSFSAVPRSGSWLSLAGSSFTTPASVQVSVNPAGLAPGTYTDYVDLNGRAQSVPVTLVVTDAVVGGNVTVVPTGLSFAYQVGAAAPLPQTLMVASATAGAPAIGFAVSIPSGGGWLSATPATGVTQATVTVRVNPAGLTAGTQSGTVRVQPSGGTIVNIPVTLTVSGPAVSVDATDLAFTYQLGAASNPAPKTVHVTGGASVSFTAQANSTGNWLSVTPTSGTADNAALTVSVNPSGLEPGETYRGTILVTGGGGTGSATINVSLRVQAPAPTIMAVVNSASYYASSISPGEIVSIFGTNLGPTAPVGLTLDSNGKVATAAGGVKVFFSGYEAPIAFASSSQLNVVVPYEIRSLSSVNVYTRFLDQGSNSVAVPVTPTAPGIFTMDASGSGLGAILNADYSVNGPSRPTAKGSAVMVYVTGEGDTSPAGVTGAVTVLQPSGPLTPAPLGNIAVLVDGQPARVAWAGEAPGFVSGLLQLNVEIPANARSGNLPIQVSIGARSSQTGVTVSVQ